MFLYTMLYLIINWNVNTFYFVLNKLLYYDVIFFEIKLIK